MASSSDKTFEAAQQRHHHLGPVEIPDSLYSLGEEIAHAITHGVGVLLAIVGLTVLVARAALYGNSWHIIASSVFGATLVLMYTASTLYHRIPNDLPRAKKVLRVIDHSMIYFLIAGTYPPFTLELGSAAVTATICQ